MAPNASPKQAISGARDTITVLGDHSDLGAEEEVDSVDSVEVLSDNNESAPDDDDAFEEVSQVTKRKATSSAPKTPTAKKRRGKLKTSSPLIDRPVRDGITKRYMEILLLCKEEGLLNSNEPSLWEPVWDKSWEPVWDKLLDMLSREFPKYEWTKELLQKKYDIERRRYHVFITFLWYSGTLYNEVTGMVTGSKAFFKAFISEYSNGWWLPDMALGNYGVYKEVFWREKPYRFKLDISEDDTAESEEDDIAESKEATIVP